jgi:peptidoglycan/xylan/chitin deacetylase (PgdA/CDA1 family)
MMTGHKLAIAGKTKMKPNLKASLSLDLDNLWSYLKIHGDDGWESYPSYLDIVVPRILDFLAQRHLKITFFIVGQDAVLEKNHAALRLIADAGHEIGNHSFSHEPWLHLYPEEQITEEITATHLAIQQVTGQSPCGFRGPGYSHSPTLLKILAEHGYTYDASTLPTWLGPLARYYYFMTTDLTPEEKARRKQLFGHFRDGLQPLRPFKKNVSGIGDKNMLEIPVSTMPIFKVPFHPSYLLYLSRLSPAVAHLYFNMGLKLCRILKIQPSILLHPLDFLGADDNIGLEFFPSMNMQSSEKLSFMSEVIDNLENNFQIVTMREHADNSLDSLGIIT